MAGLAASLAGAVLLFGRTGSAPVPARAPAPAAPRPPAAAPLDAPRAARGAAPRADPGDDATGADPDPASGGEYPVDLEALRARMPDNLYWLLGAPTDDPMVLQQRAEEEVRWNELFGKVQSGTASEEEIADYYDHRQRLSEDYLAFATAVLEEHRDDLPERDVGLYELSRDLHRKRLAEIPRQLEAALARKKEQDERRAAWGGRGARDDHGAD
ncbi:MAG: hypothetical protein IT372_26750 [Polyangiaceae bacterium]|nr:hypothetical protein [Polyangiaceae bacterium]